MNAICQQTNPRGRITMVRGEGGGRIEPHRQWKLFLFQEKRRTDKLPDVRIRSSYYNLQPWWTWTVKPSTTRATTMTQGLSCSISWIHLFLCRGTPGKITFYAADYNNPHSIIMIIEIITTPTPAFCSLSLPDPGTCP